MSTVVAVIGFVLLVAVIHWVRTAANDAFERGFEALFAAARPTRPEVWTIRPGEATAADLAARLRADAVSPEVRCVEFSVAGAPGSEVVRCTARSVSNLQGAQSSVLRRAREIDPSCQLHL